MENNFEKEVRQKMEELSLTPSAPVWEGVQAAIRRKQDRRRLVLWLLPLLLLGGGISYLFFENNQPLPVAVGHSEGARKQSGSDPVPAPESSTTNNKEETIKPSEKRDQPSNEAPSVAAGNTDRSSKNISVTAVPVRTARSKVKRTAALSDPVVDDRATTKADHPVAKPETSQKEDETLRAEPADRTVNDSGLDNEFVLPYKVQRITIDPTQEAIQLPAPAGSFVPDTIALQRPVLQVQRRVARDWQWGLTARAGISGTGSIGLGGLKAESSRFALDPATNSGGGSTAARRPQSEPQESFAFSVGAFLKRNLGSRAWMEGGLLYSYYSTRMTVGSKRTDTAVTTGFSNTAMMVESYYRNDGNITRHTNQMHFVELPLKFGYRPLKNIPLQVQHGITAGRYIAGNQLQYNSFANIYYESDESLRKLQWHLLSSVDYRLVHAKNFSAFAGPELQYGLSALKEDGTSNRLFFAGLKTRFEF